MPPSCTKCAKRISLADPRRSLRTRTRPGPVRRPESFAVASVTRQAGAYPRDVAISDRTRKILWARAGGRCSICRTLVVTEETEADAPSVFGEEAHIISAAPNGPRAGDLPDHDVYGNLILLCSKDHKRIDDQVAHYTVALLSTIKRDHERWIIGLGDGSSRPRLVPDPTRPIPRALHIVTSGSGSGISLPAPMP